LPIRNELANVPSGLAELAGIARRCEVGGFPHAKPSGVLIPVQITPRSEFTRSPGVLEGDEKLVWRNDDAWRVLMPAVRSALWPAASQVHVGADAEAIWLGLQAPQTMDLAEPDSLLDECVLSLFCPLDATVGLYLDRLHSRPWTPADMENRPCAKAFFPMASPELARLPALADSVRAPDNRSLLHLPAKLIRDTRTTTPAHGLPTARWYRVPWPESDRSLAATRLHDRLLLNVVMLTDRLFSRLGMPQLRLDRPQVLEIGPSEECDGPEQIELLRIEDGPIRFRDQAQLGPYDAPTYHIERVGLDERTLVRVYFDSRAPSTPLVSLVRWPRTARIPIRPGDTVEPQRETSFVGMGTVLSDPMPLQIIDGPPVATLAAIRAFVSDWPRFDLKHWAVPEAIRAEGPRWERVGGRLAPVVHLVIPLVTKHPLSKYDLRAAQRLLERAIGTWELDGNCFRIDWEVA
jgi:hypothetical protein